MKKSELKKMIRETIIQEGLPLPIADLQELASWLNSIKKDEWLQIQNAAEKNSVWSKRMKRACNEVLDLLSEVN